MSGETMTAVYVVMGVSGSGKSTIGRALAAHLGCRFYDGDEFHSPENIAKMVSGLPLTDADRWPWLDRLAQLAGDQMRKGEPAVLACSALKRSYRDRLRQGNQGLVFIYLRGSFDVIWDRIQDREDHYMKADLLRSQFDALEQPDEQEAVLVDIIDDADKIISKLIVSLDMDST
ncbi:MAG TPA: gluconokinase [candidate division Zixibacteria bacterium]|nr:gluconokinase [candidate division Zixibacteria bacterium]